MTLPYFAKICAMSFQGNARNGLQQDAFFLIDDYYQINKGITPVFESDDSFCVAVSDGVAESKLSGYVSLAVAKSVKQLWQNYLDNPNQSPIMDIQTIYETIATMPKRYQGASATLALLYRLIGKSDEIVIKHIGDSRVYHFSAESQTWQCKTRDHNLLNQLIDEKAINEDCEVSFNEYNQTGMASPMYALTDCLTVDSDIDCNPMPSYGSQILNVKQGDCVVVCTDGVHDLVPCDEWQVIDNYTNLQDWLRQLCKQIYASKGRAYDNATAVVIKFFSNEC